MMLFDLDGTLVDSCQDLTTGINLMLGELRLPLLTVEKVSQFVGDGARMLVERGLTAGLNREPDETELKHGLALFKRAYGEHLLDHTVAYPNVMDVLVHFSDIHKAVVTNKPYNFTMKILEGLHLASFFPVVLGGDSLTERKPHPEPILTALAACHVAPSEAVMVGDSANDILAGRLAGVMTCGVTYGLRGKDELIAAGADVIIHDFIELTHYFTCE